MHSPVFDQTSLRQLLQDTATSPQDGERPSILRRNSIFCTSEPNSATTQPGALALCTSYLVAVSLLKPVDSLATGLALFVRSPQDRAELLQVVSKHETGTGTNDLLPISGAARADRFDESPIGEDIALVAKNLQRLAKSSSGHARQRDGASVLELRIGQERG